MKVKISLFVLASMLAAACGTTGSDEVMALTADSAAGKPLYETHCASCHAADFSGIGSAPALEREPGERSEIVDTILDGKGEMPSFRDQLEYQEIADISAYVTGQ